MRGGDGRDLRRKKAEEELLQRQTKPLDATNLEPVVGALPYFAALTIIYGVLVSLEYLRLPASLTNLGVLAPSCQNSMQKIHHLTSGGQAFDQISQWLNPTASEHFALSLRIIAAANSNFFPSFCGHWSEFPDCNNRLLQ
jgi:hypothetical protein